MVILNPDFVVVALCEATATSLPTGWEDGWGFALGCSDGGTDYQVTDVNTPAMLRRHEAQRNAPQKRWMDFLPL